MMQLRLIAAVSACALISVAIVAPSQAQSPSKISYDKQVKPILKKYCYACHNPQDPSGKLDLTTQKAILKGGLSGATIKANKSKESWLVIRMKGEKGKPIMPPGRRKPTAADIKLVADWIDQGATFDSQ